LNDDEAMIIELSNSVKNRMSLRNKHLTQLEENKASLNEIKTKASKNILKANEVDQEFPPEDNDANINQETNGTRTDSPSRTRAVETILTRVASAKLQIPL